MSAPLPRSLLDRLLELPAAERAAEIMRLPEDDALALLFDWKGIWSRSNQAEPKTDVPWLKWFLCGGRGSGKTRPAAEFCVDRAIAMPGSRGFVAARTLEDVRSTCFEGDSGILACLHPSIRREWKSTTCVLRIFVGDRPTVIKGFTSEKPAQGRGPQHHWGWCDELAAWLKEGDLFDQLMFGLRLPWPGRYAQCVIASTPTPIARIRDLVRKDGKRIRTPDGLEFIECVVSKMSTYENLANLSPAAWAQFQQYEGTRLGRQELFGELLDDTPGALWRRAWFDRRGFRLKLELEDFDYLLVAIDPAITSKSEDDGDESDMTGIVAGGRLKRGAYLAHGKRGMYVDTQRDHYAVLADWSMRAPPEQWSEAAVELFHMIKADKFVGETNRGGELVEAVIRQAWEEAPYEGVNASRGKRTRAEPISTMYEQGRVHHAMRPFMPSQRIRDWEPLADYSRLERLEDQLCTWVPFLSGKANPSPDRLDANVWMLTHAVDGARIFAH